MEDLAQAAETVAQLMRLLTTTGGLRLRFRITAGAGAADPHGLERRDIYVECKGPDTALLLEREGELLRALEHIATKMLRLEPDEHDRISIDAEGFKAGRAEALRSSAEDGIASVRKTDRPFRFRPMSSRERRMLHLFLKDAGLQTASSGEGAQRYVVLYPPGYRVPQEPAAKQDSPAQERAFQDRRGPSHGERGWDARDTEGPARRGTENRRRS